MAQDRMLPHLNAAGEVHMVSVSGKDETLRRATAQGRLRAPRSVCQSVRDGTVAKGDVLAVARVAAIMAAKKTHEWIPLCHPIALTAVEVVITVEDEAFLVIVQTETRSATGVEMEAITGVSAALLTLYDMLKAQNRGLVLDDIHLVKKTGGKTGDYVFPTHESEANRSDLDQ
ncbi:MAG: cyclic pyranopterin monophosphate synthase MoaC [Sulfobacillus sp.]